MHHHHSVAFQVEDCSELTACRAACNALSLVSIAFCRQSASRWVRLITFTFSKPSCSYYRASTLSALPCSVAAGLYVSL